MAANLAVMDREDRGRSITGTAASPSSIDDTRCAGPMYPGYQISAVYRTAVAATKSTRNVRNSLGLGLSIARHLSFQRWSCLLLHALCPA